MGWVNGESSWFLCPYFADVFEGREALEGFEPPPIIIGVDEVVKVGVELLMAIVMIAFDGGVLDRPVHAFHLAIGPGMLDLGEAVLNPVFLAAHVEHMDRRTGTFYFSKRIRRPASFNQLSRRFLDSELGAVAGGGEDSDEDIGRHAPRVAIRDGRDAGSGRACTFGDVGMRVPSGLDDLGERNGQVRPEFHFSRVAGR